MNFKEFYANLHDKLQEEFQEILDNYERLEKIEKKYNELLLAVGNKYPDESRHETALRYIKTTELRLDAGLEPIK